MEKILEIGKEGETWVIRIKLPQVIPEEARGHFKTALKEFREGLRTLREKPRPPTKVEIS